MMRLVIASVLLVLAFGCSPKRTELGYGFYDVGADLIRRVPSPDGKIVDENWWPSKYTGGKRSMVGGSSHGTRYLWVVLSEDDFDFDLKFSSWQDLQSHYQERCEVVEIDISIPEFRELGTYAEALPTVEPDDPVREGLEMSFSMIMAFMASGHGLRPE